MRLILLLVLVAAFAMADEAAAPLKMDTDLSSVLAHYQRAADTRVYVSPWVDLRRHIKIESPAAVRKEQGAQLIRATLLESYEILIRETKIGESLVESTTQREHRKPREHDPNERMSLQFPNTALPDVLMYYEGFSGQPVFAALNLGSPGVTIITKENLTPSQVLPFIREALGDEHGIELATLFSGEILVKGPSKRRPARAPAVPQPKTRVRPIRN